LPTCRFTLSRPVSSATICSFELRRQKNDRICTTSQPLSNETLLPFVCYSSSVPVGHRPKFGDRARRSSRGRSPSTRDCPESPTTAPAIDDDDDDVNDSRTKLSGETLQRTWVLKKSPNTALYGMIKLCSISCYTSTHYKNTTNI
jgi:hypothetical protein